ncbi:hypothetical protein A3B45_04150 [Candidatus Daviesbacteria bacterium RIFCSPLOWO2_01_FULL_39_12]|uniref:Uncharacterized protein n=1 Tax=Candidatus Daviesbacteria bacterium RIFCSPLOWO2_01_FULL_39_12 TaxID=1797785 RepID=A0A1F5KT65_9BACT|nr:MAG: hypothetical protein A3B45_04150 [Candidatus Daviesbacteria bacterium RIFCSPLOWO2_01_FULL_39_12]
MDDTAKGSLTSRNLVHFIDDHDQKITDDLHQKTSEQLNKAGFSLTPQSVDPQQKSMIEKIKILSEEARHDLSRLAEQTKGELTSGTHYISDIKSSGPLAIKAELESKKQQIKK